MEAIDRKFNSIKNRNGSALVMVIVLTVLLALIAAMFILMSRVDEMSTKSIKTDRQLDAAVGVIVERIEDVLAEDVYSGGTRLSRNPNAVNEAWDYPKHTLGDGGDNLPDTLDDRAFGFSGIGDDMWLANLEPDMVDMSVDSGAATVDFQTGFRHITDLYDSFAGGQYGSIAWMYDAAYNYYSGPGGGTSFGPYVDREGNRISMRNLRAVILDTEAPIEAGYKADADGEGVADSRWFVIPNMTTQKGENIYAAVRIIDNGAMINANTAYRSSEDPLIMTNPGQWNGSQLSHVNLEGITDPVPTARLDAALVQNMRYGTVTTTPVPGALNFYNYLNDIEYEVNVARRLSNPTILTKDPTTGLPINEMFLPFDIGDELELRNRFFLTTSFQKIGTVTRLSQTWPTKFNPQGNTGRGLPVGSHPIDSIPTWYKKVGPNAIGESNRRHYTTVINNEKGLARIDDGSVTVYPVSMDSTDLNDEQKIGITLPLEIQDGSATTAVKENYIKRLAMGIYRGLPVDADLELRFGSDSTNKPIYTREQLAWQMAINMVDYQDDKVDALGNDLPEEITTYLDTATNTTYYGTESIDALKKDTICISKIGYTKRNGPAMVRGTYYGIEIFNPDDDTAATGAAAKDLTDYKIIVLNKQGNTYRYGGEFDLSGTVEHSGSTDGAGDTTTFVFYDSPPAFPKTLIEIASNLNAVYNSADNPARVIQVTPMPWVDIAKGDKIMVINTVSGMPVDCVTVPAGFGSGTTARRRVILPGTNFLLPATSSVDPWVDTPPIFGERLGEDLDPQPDGTLTDAELIEPQDSVDPDIQELESIGAQLAQTDQQLSNIAEIENVLAVGTRLTFDDGGTPGNTPAEKADDTYECTTLIQSIAESCVAILNLDGVADLTADREAGIDMKTFGRISLNDPDYLPLLDSLTYFDPARDGVDLHNIAEGILPVVTAGSLDASSGIEDTITDGMFLSRYTSDPLHNDEIYWTNLATLIEIDLGGSFDIYGIIVQTGDNDEYLLEYDDGTGYQPLWTVEDSFGGGGLQTSPDAEDDGKWHLLSTPVSAEKIRISAVSGDGFFSVSEIQVGVNIGSYEPYFYGDNIAGRININTAPWYVINQLPWVEDMTASEPGSLAQAIVAFRDKAATPLVAVDYSGLTGRFDITDITGISEAPGFTDIAELMQVINKDSVTDPLLEPFDIRKNIFDGVDAVGGDYTADGVVDDFEERNLIFQRISNLVTVRSDVFTAYILVRIGTDGPQRRMMAIFDRSEVNSPTDKPKLLAIQPVPDPR